MKKIIVLVSLFYSTIATAQLDKGVWLGGGSGSFYSYNETYTSPTYLSLIHI